MVGLLSRNHVSPIFNQLIFNLLFFFQAAYAELVTLRVRTLAVGLYTQRLNKYEFMPRPWS